VLASHARCSVLLGSGRGARTLFLATSMTVA
jgi:hypothetical protein